MASKQPKGKERKGKDKYLVGNAIPIPDELKHRVDKVISENEKSSVEVLISMRQIFEASKTPTFYEQSLQFKLFAKTVDQKLGGTDKSHSPLQELQLHLCSEMIIEALFGQSWETRIAEDMILVLKHIPPKFISEKMTHERLSAFLVEINKNPKSQYAYGLDVLSNNEVFLNYIKANMWEIFGFFSNLLNSIYDALQEGYGVSSTQDAANGTVEMLKGLLVIQSKVAQLFSSEMKQIIEKQTNEDSKSWKGFKKLLQALIQFLQSELPPKEAIWGASLTLCQFVAQASIVSNNYQEILFTYLQNHQFQVDMKHNSFIDTVTPETKFSFSSFPPISELFSYRALVLAVPMETLLRPLPKKDNSLGSLLFDSILPSIYNFCNTAQSRYTRLIAIQSTAECLQKVLDALTSHEESKEFNPFQLFLEKQFEEILDLVWKYWDDSFEPVVVQTRSVFGTLLEIYDMSVKKFGDSMEKMKVMKATFIRDLTMRLIAMDWGSKAKYNILTLLFHRIGAKHLLSIYKDFPFQLLDSMREASISTAASNLLEEFLKNLKSEIPQDSESFELWLPSLVEILTTRDLSVHKSVVTHALPAIMAVYPSSFRVLLVEISKKLNDNNGKQILKSLLCILKTARKLRKINADDLPDLMHETQITTAELIKSGVTQEDEDVVIDALELVCNSFKETEAPTDFEREMLNLFLSQNLKATSTRIRNEAAIQIRLFLQRLKESTRKLQKEAKRKKKNDEALDIVNNAVSIVNSLCQTLVSSIYPGAPFAREQMALQFYQSVIDIWGPNPVDSSPAETILDGLKLEIFSPRNTLAILHCLWGRFDASKSKP